MSLTRFASTVAVVLAFLAITGSAFAARRELVLHTFRVDTGSDGYYPFGPLIFDVAGNLYGTTSRGTDSGGTVFELTPGSDGTWTETILNNCSPNCTAGSPFGGVIFDGAGNLYGTTMDGGAYDGGTVFELTPGLGGTWTETILYNFCSVSKCADGGSPYANLIFDAAGNLYSTTSIGGARNGGTVFELTPGADGKWREKVLHSFEEPGHTAAGPFGGVVFDSAGNLYGTTWAGGIKSNNSNNCDPYSKEGCGRVFELMPNADGTWSERTLHRFNGKDGANPQAGVVLDGGGNVYGTTYYGGAGCNGEGCGVAFRLTQVNGRWTEKVIHDFNVSGADGYFPFAGLTFDAAGNLYGTTSYSVPGGAGTVFELTPGADDKWTEIIVHNWGTCEFGCGPESPVTFDQDGNLYGTTLAGTCGENCGGTVYEIKAKPQ